MSSFPIPDFLAGYWQDGFQLKPHLQDFLQLDTPTLEARLQEGKDALAQLGRHDFTWESATEFYRDQVGAAHLFDLGAWHLTSQDYIGDTLRLLATFAKGYVLDFGGGIGTHAIAAALCPQVDQVIYCDINPMNRDFVEKRAAALGLSSQIKCCLEVPPGMQFETIVCFDVLEHLPDPSQQLKEFYQLLTPQGKTLLNWYFFKGLNQEFPFHLEDPQLVAKFFDVLRQNFQEVFHPYFITARCYQPS